MLVSSHVDSSVCINVIGIMFSFRGDDFNSQIKRLVSFSPSHLTERSVNAEIIIIFQDGNEYKIK